MIYAGDAGLLRLVHFCPNPEVGEESGEIVGSVLVVQF